MKSKVKTIGILGSGQLGRMSALAAAELGIKVHVYSPEADSPAEQVSAKGFVGDYTDKKKLRAFAKSVDVVSYEFENIPVESVRFIQKIKPVYPDDKLLEVSQNRITEKSYLNNIGIPTAKWAPIYSPEDIDKAVGELGGKNFVLKTTRFGYDGKGQTTHKAGDSAKRSFSKLGSDELILEEMVNFKCEISIIIARDKFGKSAVYGPVENVHKNHILHTSTVPAKVDSKVAAKAKRVARKLADSVGLIGVLGLEMFVTKDGQILANEIAPRTHNSGHLTIDACAASQFEQHVRTISGLPVSDPTPHSNAVMTNLIGNDVNQVKKYYDMKGACIHIYGKSEARAGRKMGHVTVIKPIKK
ncbi:MAG: 5-(carboxyamino)imidazole ribonucleotide synthase [Thermodesulfobacteriota bacterium]